MKPTAKTYAIVPAAGFSRRMGQPKLLLPWGDGRIIDRVLQTWTQSNVDQTFVVLRADDHDLRMACNQWPVEVVVSQQATRDMKASICLALDHIEKHETESGWNDAGSQSGWFFVAPADLPDLDVSLINPLLELAAQRSAVAANDREIIAPKFGEKIGHPILLPWRFANEIRGLAEQHGLDWLVKTNPVASVAFSADQRIKDIDTKAEYDEARRRQ